jgi:hypothetical protein
MQSVTITGAVTITFSTPTHPGKFMLFVTQDATGHVYSFTGVKWSGGTPPTLSTAANKIDVLSFAWNGSYFVGTGSAAWS